MSGPDVEDIKRAVNKLKIRASPGPSGLSNLIMKNFVEGKEEHHAVFITYLINGILRGWIDDDDFNLINTTRGVALDKGNNDWRPICVSESIMGVVESCFLIQAKEKLLEMAGAEEHHQLGLISDGMVEGNRFFQLSWEKDIFNQTHDKVFIMYDAKNAFNELYKNIIHDMLDSKFSFNCIFPNYWSRIYKTNGIVDFGESDLIANMMRGTHQGRKSSPLVFDAVLMTWLKKEKIFNDSEINYDTTWIRFLHDDIVVSGTPKDLQRLHVILVKALKKCGLDLQSKKTKILHHKEILQNNTDKTDFENLINVLEVTDDHISTEGAVFGGIPFGNDNYIKDFLKNKFVSFKDEVTKVRDTGTKAQRDIGIAISHIRFCISTKWTHLLRAIPKRLWMYGDNNENSLLRDIDEVSWQYFLHVLDLKKLRHKPAIMKEEEEISRRIFFLSCKDGGLGVTCIERTVDSAFVGTWIAIMKHVVKDQLNLDDPKSLEQQLQTIKDVKNATNRLLIDLASNKFEGPEQEDSVGMSDNDENKNYKSPKLTIRELLRKIADHAGLASNDEIDILWNRGIQSTLGHALSVVNANSLAEYLAKFGCPAGKNIKLQDNQFYISFMSRRNDFSNRFLNRAHLSDKARRFTNKDLKSTIASILMLQRYPLEYKCAHCGMDDVRFIGHIQSCEKSHATTKTNNGKAEIKYGSRNHTLHKIAKFFLQWFFNSS